MAAPIGHPRWGGRRAGTPNKVNLEVRNRIEAEADPLGFLIQVVKGRKVRGEYPTIAQRMRAAEKLLGKIVPDIKAIELSVDAEVRREVGEEAKEKVLRMLETKIHTGIVEGLKRCGMTDKQAYDAMKNQATSDSPPIRR